MKKHLHFVCPTDHLESVINDTFKHENYYVTSLGNSIMFDTQIMYELLGLITVKDIQEITFVLSDTNKIILDALENRDFVAINGLDMLYREMSQQKDYKEKIWGKADIRIPVLSHYLNKKITELSTHFSEWRLNDIKINAKIYKKEESMFEDVFADVLYYKYFSLN
ncbi:MAG: hypothetical protein AAF611_05905 [Bacteroidota bacterium]